MDALFERDCGLEAEVAPCFGGGEFLIAAKEEDGVFGQEGTTAEAEIAVGRFEGVRECERGGEWQVDPRGWCAELLGEEGGVLAPGGVCAVGDVVGLAHGARAVGGVEHGVGDVVDIGEAAGGSAVVDVRHEALTEQGCDLLSEVFAAWAVDGCGAEDGDGKAFGVGVPDGGFGGAFGLVVGQAGVDEGMIFGAGNFWVAVDVGGAYVQEALEGGRLPGGGEQVFCAGDVCVDVGLEGGPVCGAGGAVEDVGDVLNGCL